MFGLQSGRMPRQAGGPAYPGWHDENNGSSSVMQQIFVIAMVYRRTSHGQDPHLQIKRSEKETSSIARVEKM